MCVNTSQLQQGNRKANPILNALIYCRSKHWSTMFFVVLANKSPAVLPALRHLVSLSLLLSCSSLVLHLPVTLVRDVTSGSEHLLVHRDVSEGQRRALGRVHSSFLCCWSCSASSQHTAAHGNTTGLGAQRGLIGSCWHFMNSSERTECKKANWLRVLDLYCFLRAFLPSRERIVPIAVTEKLSLIGSLNGHCPVYVKQSPSPWLRVAGKG